MKFAVKILAITLALGAALGMTSCGMIFEFAEDALEELMFKDEVEVVIEYESIQIDNKMMSFFFNETVNNWYENYSAYLNYFSVNFEDDLKAQSFGGASYDSMFLGNFSGSWYDYFMKITLDDVKNYVIFADYANSCGMELRDEDNSEIDDYIATLEGKMNRVGAEYEDWYGRGVDEDTVRRCYSLMLLAEYGSELLSDEFRSEISEEDIEEWCEDNEGVNVAKCWAYTMTVSSKDLDRAEFDELCANAMDIANRIAESTSLESFKNANNDVEIDVELACCEVYVSAEDGGIVANRFFGDDEVKSGDTIVIDRIEAVDKEHDLYTVTVYYVVDPSVPDERLTHNFAYVLTADEQTAEKILSKLKNKDVESISEFMTVMENGNWGDSVSYSYFENAISGLLSYDNVNAWIEDEGRRAGDISEILELNSSIVNKYSFTQSKAKAVETEEEENDEETSNGTVIFAPNSGASDVITFGDSTVKYDTIIKNEYQYVIGGNLTVIGGEVSYQYAIVVFDSHGFATYEVLATDALVAEMVEKWSKKVSKVKVYDDARDVDFYNGYTNSGFFGSAITYAPTQDGSYTIITTPGGFSKD